MISQATYELVKDHVPTRQLEPIIVKGLAQPISVWEVMIEEAVKDKSSKVRRHMSNGLS